MTSGSSLILPPDGTYEVWVHGFSVSGSPDVPLTIDIVQGTDLSVSGLPAGPLAAGNARDDPRRFTRRFQ